MAQYRQNVSYALNQPLNADAPFPVQAKRAPVSSDLGYKPGTLWVNLVTNLVYVLSGITNNVALWVQIESSGASGSFTTLTSTGATTLATTGASTNTFGNTTGTTSLSLLVGTGNFSLDGVGASTYTIAPSVTTGTINIGGTGANTGNITIGGGTGAQAIAIGNSTGGKTIAIGGGAGDNSIFIGSNNSTSNTTLSAGSGGIALNAPFVELTAGANPVYIYTGAGAPSGGLALHVGDMYINTTAASATTRLYIATAVGTWTNVTCAA